ncbi:GAF domain-containing protein [Cystobacter fuscus]
MLQFAAGVPPLSSEEAGALPSPELLPLSLVAYARRTGEYVLLHDLAQPHPFSADPYFATNDARALLCLPLRRQENFYGLLYLENSLTTQAFSHERIALLEHRRPRRPSPSRTPACTPRSARPGPPCARPTRSWRRACASAPRS